MTSPLERAILAHYYCSPEPYMGGSENWSIPVNQAVDRFLEMGLLEAKAVAGGGVKIFPNSAALQVYMEALSAVPLPVQRWVIP